MDIHPQGNSQLRYAANGGAVSRNAKLGEDALHFLTQEEKDCIRFFENTIDSLEETLEDGRTKTLESRPARDHVDRAPSPFTSKDQDVIDLVRPDPDLVPGRDHFSGAEFQSLIPAPQSHFEVKPRRDPVDGFLPDCSPTDSHTHPPPGCIPTPVLIAQKMAENRGGGASGVDPASVFRRLSLEPQTTDPPVRLGPPTSVKPSRLPANISMVLNSRDREAPPLVNVNIQERRAQMLANLSGTSHPLLQENAQPVADGKTRNTPTRSISFRDPTPDKSRMEALSKLGLNRNRAMSGGPTLFDDPDGNTTGLAPGADAGAKFLDPRTETPPLSLSSSRSDRKPEILRSDSRRSYEDRLPQPSLPPPSASQTSYCPSSTMSPPPEVTSIEINSYGGKSIMVNPSVTLRTEPPAPLTSPEYRTVSMSRSDLPDILSSHIDKSLAAPGGPEPLAAQFNSYGGKSMNINPSTGLANRRPDAPARSSRVLPPPPAPKPPRHSHHAEVTQQLAASRALSPDHKKKANLFRPQSITVEFSGRGPTDESRRAALRKLGLLRDL